MVRVAIGGNRSWRVSRRCRGGDLERRRPLGNVPVHISGGYRRGPCIGRSLGIRQIRARRWSGRGRGLAVRRVCCPVCTFRRYRSRGWGLARCGRRCSTARHAPSGGRCYRVTLAVRRAVLERSDQGGRAVLQAAHTEEEIIVQARPRVGVQLQQAVRTQGGEDVSQHRGQSELLECS